MRYTVPWIPRPGGNTDVDELSGTAIMLGCLVGGLVARKTAPVDGDVLASALVALFGSSRSSSWTDDELVKIVSTSILLAHSFGLIELELAGPKRWRSTSWKASPP